MGPLNFLGAGVGNRPRKNFGGRVKKGPPSKILVVGVSLMSHRCYTEGMTETMDTTTQPATEVDWYLGHIERLTAELEAADTPAAAAIARTNRDSCQAAIRRIKADEAAGAWWCVVLEDGEHVQVAYRGNGGFGPVNVWQRGWYVPVRYRQHTSGPDRLCDCEVA